MNNRELYVKLRENVGIIGTVYYRDAIGTYGRTRDVYIPACITHIEYTDIVDGLKLKLRFIGYPGSTKDNVSVADIYLPSPMNSRFHGNMIPVRSYFELLDREQGSNDSYDRCLTDLRSQMIYTGVRGQRYATIRYKATAEQFEYNKIIFSGPCTIVIWKDGTKTMTRVSKEDTFDPEKGVAICFMKRALGHTETNKLLRKELEKYWDEQKGE